MGTANEEIELKFLCEPADLDALLAAAEGVDDSAADLSATYFDTPERRLRELGAGLRIRQEPKGRLQTLKAGAGLRRQEDETPVEGDLPDPEHAALRELIGPEEVARLEPLFTVKVHRRKRLLSRDDAQVELAVDQGEVRAGRRKTTICEVELELKAGAPAALFALARELFEVAPLYLSFETKADQGFALADGGRSAKRHDQPDLKRGMSAAAAFQAIARSALAQIAANGLILRGADSPEALHQLRVAARRLRSAMTTFKPLIADDRREPLKDELKWLAGACDEARNLDVFIDETYRPAAQGAAAIHGLADLGQALETARGSAHAHARGAVASTRFRALLLELYAWIETGAWLDALEEGGGTAEDFAAKALSRRRRKLEKKGADLMELSDEARHQARIQAKKLRYGAEAFRPLLKDKTARRLIKKTKKLQEALGALNDAVSAEALLTGLALEGAALYAAGHLAGELQARRADHLKAAERAWAALSKTDDAW